MLGPFLSSSSVNIYVMLTMLVSLGTGRVLQHPRNLRFQPRFFCRNLLKVWWGLAGLLLLRPAGFLIPGRPLEPLGFASKVQLSCFLSVYPLCSLCLGGEPYPSKKNHHRGTENTEVVQRRTQPPTFEARPSHLQNTSGRAMRSVPSREWVAAHIGLIWIRYRVAVLIAF